MNKSRTTVLLLLLLPAITAGSNSLAKTDQELAIHPSIIAQEVKQEAPLESGYYVNVATKEVEREAHLLLGDVAMLGLRGRLEKVQTKSKITYRVLAGPFQSRESAEKAKIKIETNSLGNKTVTIEQVGMVSKIEIPKPKEEDDGY